MEGWEFVIYNRLSSEESSMSVQLPALFELLQLSFCSLVFDVRAAEYMGAIASCHKVKILGFFWIERSVKGCLSRAADWSRG